MTNILNSIAKYIINKTDFGRDVLKYIKSLEEIQPTETTETTETTE
jgi:hypothetical protein